MAARTIQTGADVDAAMEFLGKRSNPPISGEQYFLNKVDEVVAKGLNEADEKRFNLLKGLMDDKDKGKSISNIREILGV